VAIHEDNQACITVIQQPRQHQRMKHIDVKYMFLREAVNTSVVELEYISAESCRFTY